MAGPRGDLSLDLADSCQHSAELIADRVFGGGTRILKGLCR